MNPSGIKRKVVHVITRFDKGGSAENTFLTVCGLDKDHYEVVLVTGVPPQEDRQNPEVRAIKANIDALTKQGVRWIPLRHLVRELQPFSDLCAFLSLLRIFRLEKPHIVHTHTSKAGILGRWAAFLCRVPVIVHTPHGHVFWGYFGSLQTRMFILLEKWTALITNAIITLTPQEKADHLCLGIAPENKFKIIHSGVDITRYGAPVGHISDIKKSLNLPDESFVVGTVGRLTPIKGHLHLLKAAARILDGRSNIFFVLVGEGELHEELKQYVQDAGVANNIRFTGWQADVKSLLSVFDLFAFPSLNEGMGKALVEAMAMAKPVVASNIGGIPDLIVPGENGLLVPPADVTTLADAIMTLYEDPEKRREMGERGRKRAMDYSVEGMISKIAGMYESLSGRESVR